MKTAKAIQQLRKQWKMLNELMFWFKRRGRLLSLI